MVRLLRQPINGTFRNIIRKDLGLKKAHVDDLKIILGPRYQNIQKTINNLNKEYGIINNLK